MEVRYKIWLEDNGPVFGDGVAALLLAIDQLGSLNQAAVGLKMSYRQAWGKIKKTEERLGIKLVETKRGGKRGGGACLTRDAEKIMKKYLHFREEVDRFIQDCFARSFI